MAGIVLWRFVINFVRYSKIRAGFRGDGAAVGVWEWNCGRDVSVWKRPRNHFAARPSSNSDEIRVNSRSMAIGFFTAITIPWRGGGLLWTERTPRSARFAAVDCESGERCVSPFSVPTWKMDI